MLLGRHLVQSLRVPLFESELSDLWDNYDDLAGAIDDLVNELRASAPALTDLNNETEDLFNENDRLGLIESDTEQSIISDLSFSDMPTQSDFKEAFEPLIAYRIVRGNKMYSNAPAMLYPQKNVTRFEFIKMLLKSTCTSPGLYYNDNYATEALNNYFAKDGSIDETKSYLAKAVADGIISGYGDGNLYPNYSITRFEAAKILSKFYKIKTTGTLSTGEMAFADVIPGSGEVATYVYTATSAGFFNQGSSTNRYFRPGDKLTRSEAIKIMWSAFGKSGHIFTTIKESDFEMPDDSIY